MYLQSFSDFHRGNSKKQNQLDQVEEIDLFSCDESKSQFVNEREKQITWPYRVFIWIAPSVPVIVSPICHSVVLSDQESACNNIVFLSI